MSNVYALQQRVEQPVKSGKGFTLMHRKIKDCDFYKKDSEAVHLWLHLILSANSKPALIETDIGQVAIGRGQLITGRPTLCSETGISDNKIRNLLKSFATKGMILTESKNKKFTVITIVKYDDFQGLNSPTIHQDFTNGKLHSERASEEHSPTIHQDFTINNNIKNNNTSKDVFGGLSDESTQVSHIESNSEIKPRAKAGKKSPPVPYQAMIDAYHEILPDMSRIKIVRGVRKNNLRLFWQRCNSDYMKQHNRPFTLENWRGYLGYIAEHCRWMSEQRPNGKGGYWAAKNLDYLITDKCYISVKEDRANDRKSI